MVIVSQDKKAIHNFDNILSIQIEKSNSTYKLIVYDAIDDRTALGEYATEERAKEVLKGIYSHYEIIKYFETSDASGQVEIMRQFKEANKKLYVCEMPEE